MKEITISSTYYKEYITPVQAQRIAQRNKLKTHPASGSWDVEGMKITLSDLAGESTGNHGWSDNIPQLNAIAAKFGIVVDHPEGKWDRNSFLQL